MTRLQEVRWVEEIAQTVEPPQLVHNTDRSGKVNVYRLPGLRALIYSRWPQFILRVVTLISLLFTLATAIFGTRVGSHNFAIIIIWIAWWTTLKLGFIPLGGRSWCSICPIPLVGDWLQQGGIVQKDDRKHGLNLRWPLRMRSSWLQSAGFIMIGLFSAVTLTDPRVTGWVILALFVLASGMSLVFEHRAFCSNICPVGGFSALYAKTAPWEVRVVEKDICIKHKEKSCYLACPWGLYPLALKDSSACGVCLECLRACPKDNLALNLRPYGSDLQMTNRSNRLDEPFLALVMLSAALVFSAVFSGPWGWLKVAAYHIGSGDWMIYAAGFLALTIFFLPALYAASLWVWEKIRQSGQSLKHLASYYSQGLLPLGLLAWIAFTVSFALPKLNLILVVLNDPFGWGWHLLNSTNLSGSVDVSNYSPYLQLILIAMGVFWSASVTNKLADSGEKDKSHPNIPLLVFYLSYAATLLWVLVG